MDKLLAKVELPNLQALGDPGLIDADAAVVVRLSDGHSELVYAKSVDAVHHPASMAKLVTALLCVTTTATLDHQLTVSKEDLRKGSGNVFSAGDVLSLHDALKALLIPSSNTAAETLARTFTAGGSSADDSRGAFINEMNRMAVDLGLASTNFANPSGLHNPATLSTPRDMMLLLAETIRYPMLVDILGQRVAHLRIGGQQARIQRVTTSVHALDRLDVIAGKTGTLRLGDSNFHLGAIVDLGQGDRALLVLMGAHGQAGRDRDTDALLEHLTPADSNSYYPGHAYRGGVERLNASELANLVNGVWTRLPDSGWNLRRLRNSQSAARSRTASGLIAVARRAGGGLKELNTSGLSQQEVCVLTDAKIDEQHTHFPVLKVPAIDDALGSIARWHRQRYRGTVVAIAGGSDSPAVASFLRSVLSHRHRAGPPSQSSRDPLRSVQQQLVDLQTEPFAIFSLAPEALVPVAECVSPDVVVITGVDTGGERTPNDADVSAHVRQHLHGLSPDGVVVLNHDAAGADLIAEHVRRLTRRVITYGSRPGADVRLIQHSAESGHFDADLRGKHVRLPLGASDESHLANGLAVLAVLKVLGQDADRFAAVFRLLLSQSTLDQGHPHVTNSEQALLDRKSAAAKSRGFTSAATAAERDVTLVRRQDRLAGSSLASMTTPDRQFEDAETVAEIVGGTWIGTPSPDWRLERFLRVPSARRASARRRNILIPVKDPDKAIEELERSALEGSAAVLLVETDLRPESTRFAMLKATSIDDALTNLATRRRKEYSGKVVAVTGSVGKSTTRTMIGHTLSQRHETFWMQDNRNGLRAVQDQCFRLKQERYAVVEIARTGLPESSTLIRPDVAIVTAVSEAHMQDVGSLEQIAKVKAQIFAGMSPGGTAVVNQDTPHAEVLIEAAHAHTSRVITYGTSAGSDARLLDYDPQTHRASVDLAGTNVQYRISTPGAHNALNSVAALCAIRALGEDVTQFIDDFESVKLPTGRGEVSQVMIADRAVTLVDQSYNANPASMRAALEDFACRFADSRRILVLGDMRELGPTEDALHANLLEPVLRAAPDRIYLLGPLMTHLWSRLPAELQGAHVSTLAQLRGVLVADLHVGDAVLMKASRDTGLKKFVASLEVNQVVNGEVGKESWRVTVSGPAVQGVGYRQWLKKTALEHKVNGWVRNNSEGAVEALLRGRQKDVGTVCSLLQVGPPKAEVDEVAARRVSTVPHKGFRLRKTPPPKPPGTGQGRSQANRWRTLAKRAASRFQSKFSRA